MTCRYYLSCRHYCAVTDSCDYILNTGKPRPHKACLCPGYPAPPLRRRLKVLLPGSYIFDPATGQYRGRVCGYQA